MCSGSTNETNDMNKSTYAFNETEYFDTLADLARARLSIGESISRLVELYVAVYGADARDINAGLCEDFAHDLLGILGEGQVFWFDELDEEDLFPPHAFLKYRDRYYDSAHPAGVVDWHDLGDSVA